VKQVVNANQFVLQTEGYIQGAISQDDMGNPLVAGGVYYLSATAAGAISLNQPTINGQISERIYIVEQVLGTTGTDAGYIVPQRPLDLLDTAPNVETITQPLHGFVQGDWLYISADNTYARGLATALNTSQVVGVVLPGPTANTFQLQTNGFNTGTMVNDGAGASIVSGQVYYLSVTFPGRLDAVAPVGAGQYTKPLYVQQTLASRTGIILEQRPLSTSNTVTTIPGNIVQTLFTGSFVVGGAGVITPLTVTITPSNITSRIKLTFNFSMYPSGSEDTDKCFVLRRDGLDIPALKGTTAAAINGTVLGGHNSWMSFTIIDTPATILPVTYTLYKATGAAMKIGQGGPAGFPNGYSSTSTVIAEEIGP
jgi:hypothetical protein